MAYSFQFFNSLLRKGVLFFSASIMAVTVINAAASSAPSNAVSTAVVVYPYSEKTRGQLSITTKETLKEDKPFNVMESFHAFYSKLEHTAAFRDFVAKKMKEQSFQNSLGDKFDYSFLTGSVDMPENLRETLKQFQASGYKDYVQNLACFTGGGAKGLMEIITVVMIEELLNSLSDDKKEEIYNRRVEKYWKANQELQGEQKKTAIEVKIKEDKYIYFQDVVDYFAGTSTGSIIACGLAYMSPVIKDDGSIAGFKRYKAHEVAQLYYRHLPEIFKYNGIINPFLPISLWAKYDKRNLREMLRTFFSDKTFLQAFAYNNVCVALSEVAHEGTTLSVASGNKALCLNEDEVNFWKNISVAQAVEGSSSAPTFFAGRNASSIDDKNEADDFTAIESVAGRRFVDGGLCANSLVDHVTTQIALIPNNIVNVISFGAGSKHSSQSEDFREINGGAGEAFGQLKGRVGGQILEAHKKVFGLLEKGGIRSLTHINPILLDGMELDSITTLFIEQCFNQTKKELSVLFLKKIMEQLLDFITNALLPDFDFEKIWYKTYLKIVLIDFGKEKIVSEINPESPVSQTCFAQSCNDDSISQSKWLRIYIERIEKENPENLVHILHAVVKEDPYGQFNSEQNHDARVGQLKDWLTVLYQNMKKNDGEKLSQEEAEKKAKELCEKVKKHIQDNATFEYKAFRFLLPADLENLRGLKGKEPTEHAKILADIFKNHKINYHTDVFFISVIETYIKVVYEGEKVKNIEELVNALNAKIQGWAKKFVSFVSSYAAQTQRASVFQTCLENYNKEIERQERIKAANDADRHQVIRKEEEAREKETKKLVGAIQAAKQQSAVQSANTALNANNDDDGDSEHLAAASNGHGNGQNHAQVYTFTNLPIGNAGNTLGIGATPELLVALKSMMSSLPQDVDNDL